MFFQVGWISMSSICTVQQQLFVTDIDVVNATNRVNVVTNHSLSCKCKSCHVFYLYLFVDQVSKIKWSVLDCLGIVTNWLQTFHIVKTAITASRSQRSAAQRVSLIVIPFCLSGCLSVIPHPTACHDWSIRTKFGRQVYTCPRTRVSLFGSPSSHTLSARWKNIENFAYFNNKGLPFGN